jgi:hypothetical protein
MTNPLLPLQTTQLMHLITLRKHRTLFGWAAVSLLLPLCIALSGCGGGSTAAPVVYTVTNYAPSSMNGHTLTFTDPNQSQFQTVYVFSTSTYTSPSGDSGTYTYTQSATTLNQGMINIVSAFSPALTYTLTYTSGSGGTYVNQVSATGTFTMQ